MYTPTIEFTNLTYKMITMNNSLYQLCKAGYVTPETALEFSDNKNELQQALRGVYHGTFSSQG